MFFQTRNAVAPQAVATKPAAAAAATTSTTTISPTALADLSAQLASAHFTALNAALLTDWWRAAFLATHKNNVDAALNAIEKTLIWRAEYRWYDLPKEKFDAEERSGKLYWHKRDREGNPVLIFRMDRHVASKTQADAERTVRFLIWFVERAIRTGLVTNRMTLLVDRIDTTVANAEGLQFLRYAGSHIQTAFPEIMHRIVVFPTSTLLYALWKVAQGFLNPRVVGKIRICADNYEAVLLETVEEEHLPRRYGGQSVDPMDEEGWQQRAAAATSET
ncbi:hypothetical protein HDU87_003449 [Geranomyces variabilis]|uniref:CRAL-TRIO domain-containing protein n=1 Tax=Geranomyces variabilis TaxID=109894 RepID=A0AAD5TQ06_9FUNG|nr:hypothetical protein HDU87_003449 [Geranomyces variabilis]